MVLETSFPFFIYASQVHSNWLFICCKPFLFLRLYLLLGNLEFPCSLWDLLSAWSSFSYLCFAWSYLCLAQRVTDMAFFAEDVHRLARYFVLTYMTFQTCFSSSCSALGHVYLFSSPCLCGADKWVGLTLVSSYWCNINLLFLLVQNYHIIFKIATASNLFSLSHKFTNLFYSSVVQV